MASDRPPRGTSAPCEGGGAAHGHQQVHRHERPPLSILYAMRHRKHSRLRTRRSSVLDGSRAQGGAVFQCCAGPAGAPGTALAQRHTQDQWHREKLGPVCCVRKHLVHRARRPRRHSDVVIQRGWRPEPRTPSERYRWGEDRWPGGNPSGAPGGTLEAGPAYAGGERPGALLAIRTSREDSDPLPGVAPAPSCGGPHPLASVARWDRGTAKDGTGTTQGPHRRGQEEIRSGGRTTGSRLPCSCRKNSQVHPMRGERDRRGT